MIIIALLLIIIIIIIIIKSEFANHFLLFSHCVTTWNFQSKVFVMIHILNLINKTNKRNVASHLEGYIS